MARPTGAAQGGAGKNPVVMLDPLPYKPGVPGWQLWSEHLVPPAGLDWLGATPTEKAWLLPCPCCQQGWTLLVPSLVDPFGYEIDLTAGCTRQCGPRQIAWWQQLRMTEIPLPEPEPPDAREIRYARGVVRKKLATAKANPKHAAFGAAQWCKAAALDPALMLAAVATAAAVPARTLHQPF